VNLITSLTSTATGDMLFGRERLGVPVYKGLNRVEKPLDKFWEYVLGPWSARTAEDVAGYAARGGWTRQDGGNSAGRIGCA
jgi:hypothetical protein